jgi:hypothetical protein
MACVREREKSSSAFIFTTQDSPEKVIDFYSHALKSDGFTTSATAIAEGKMSGTVNGEDRKQGRNVSVVITLDSSGANVSVMYSEKRQPR